VTARAVAGYQELTMEILGHGATHRLQDVGAIRSAGDAGERVRRRPDGEAYCEAAVALTSGAVMKGGK
jgi:hypothetical protein